MATAMLLAPRGRVPFIGEETGRVVPSGVSVWRSPHGSVRYVLSVGRLPVAALQIVVGPHAPPIVANVFVREGSRRQGHASELFAIARLDYPTLEHSRPEDRTPDGDAWTRGMASRLRAVTT